MVQKKLISFIESRLNKLSQYDEKIIGAEVFLRLDKNQNAENKITEIKINISKNELFAKRQCKTFEEGVDMAVASLQRQLKKRKEKLSTHL